MNVYPTPADLDQWIAKSHKGERFVYHLGNLMHDRRFKVTLGTSGGTTVIRNIPLGDVADAAIDAYQNGYVVLAQKRIGEDLFEYLAIRTKKYRKPPLMEPRL